MRAIHPGEILADELKELNLSANAFAQALKVPANRISGILNKQRAITADTALRLARYFGTTSEFWLNLQMTYDLKIAKQKFGKKIEKEVEARDAA
ncbi:MAG: HigA family addiction module antidote protein [Proteobacteria bacterium]|nr:HigA family addiction module antidote protein [Pseudomonadota bacterium]